MSPVGLVHYTDNERLLVQYLNMMFDKCWHFNWGTSYEIVIKMTHYECAPLIGRNMVMSHWPQSNDERVKCSEWSWWSHGNNAHSTLQWRTVHHFCDLHVTFWFNLLTSCNAVMWMWGFQVCLSHTLRCGMCKSLLVSIV